LPLQGSCSEGHSTHQTHGVFDWEFSGGHSTHQAPTGNGASTDTETTSFGTTTNTPIQIPPRTRRDETVKVLDYPLSGGLNIDSIDGNITYIPSLGCVGVESFNLEICDKNQSCRVERISVTVRDTRNAANKESTNLLYLLSLLTLVPIGVLAVVCYKRLGDTANPKVESTP
jgi:hypothetical protein